MSNYQSAVEWLIQQVEDFNGLLPADIIEKAKQMEREQIDQVIQLVTRMTSKNETPP